MEMASGGRGCADGGGGGGGRLIPGLPEELAVAQIVTRLPWYARPVCRAVSKSWRFCIDSSSNKPELRLRSRKFQLPLLRAQVLVCTFDTHIFIAQECALCKEQVTGYCTMQWQDETYQIHRQWRKLPPVQGLVPPPPARLTLLASCGMVYVWSNEEPDNFVFKLDMGCGDWTWKKVHVSRPFFGSAVPFKGKIYVPAVSTQGSAPGQEKEMVLVHDMMTDQCEYANSWKYDVMGLLHKQRHSQASCKAEEELYSLVEHEMPESKLEILTYDGSKGSWRTQVKIPFPEYQWSLLQEVKLVNCDSFDPAPEEGINAVWADPSNFVISWCNSSLHETWVGFDYNAFLDGKYLEYMQFIHGSLYAIFCEDKDDQDDRGKITGMAWTRRPTEVIKRTLHFSREH